jgi:hypothetical protein
VATPRITTRSLTPGACDVVGAEVVVGEVGVRVVVDRARAGPPPPLQPAITGSVASSATLASRRCELAVFLTMSFYARKPTGSTLIVFL